MFSIRKLVNLLLKTVKIQKKTSKHSNIAQKPKTADLTFGVVFQQKKNLTSNKIEPCCQRFRY